LKKKHLTAERKFSSLNQGLYCGLKNSQVNNVKVSTLAKGISPQNLRKKEKTNKKSLNKKMLNQKRNQEIVTKL